MIRIVLVEIIIRVIFVKMIRVIFVVVLSKSIVIRVMQCHMPTSKLLKADQGPNRNTVILSSP